MRAGPGHDRADRLPGDSGPGRWGPSGQRPGGGGRCRLTARAWPLPGAVRCRLRRRQRGRAADRRVLHHPHELALDLLHQHSAGSAGPGRPRGRPAERPRAQGTPRRLPGHRSARRLPRVPGAADHPRRHDLRLGLRLHHRPRGPRCGGAGSIRLRRASGPGAGSPARALPQPGLRGHGHDGLRGGVRPVRSTHLPAAVPADRPWPQPDRLRPSARPAHGRAARDLDRLGTADLTDRALQGLSHHRHRHQRGRAVPALRPESADRLTRSRGLHARARPGSGLRDAGADPRGPERGPLFAAGHRDLLRDPLSVDRRIARNGDPRRDLLQPARARAGLAAAGRFRRDLESHLRPDQPGSGLVPASCAPRWLRELLHRFPLDGVRDRGRCGGCGLFAVVDSRGASPAQDDRGPRRRRRLPAAPGDGLARRDHA